MKCLNPITIKNEKPRFIALYGRTMQVPCGKCEACIDNKRKNWYFRLKQEERNSINAFFVTLTYREDTLPRNSLGFPTFNKRDIQLFLKRLRKQIDKFQNDWGIPTEEQLHLRYFIIGEYGSKHGRPHYHGIFFNVPPQMDLFRAVLTSWQNGRISVSECNGNRIGYCANYMYGKSDKIPDEFADETNNLPMLSSRRPGIGANYLTEEIVNWHLQGKRSYVMDGNIMYPMPQFYKGKIFIEWKDKKALYKENYARIVLERYNDYLEDKKHMDSHPDDPFTNLPSNRRINEFKRKFHNRVKKHKSNNYNHE